MNPTAANLPTPGSVKTGMRLDLGLGLLLVLLAGIGAWILASRVPPAVLDPRNPDIFFSSDTSRVHANMVSRHSNHWRTGVHPLFSIAMHPSFVVVAGLLGADLHGEIKPADALRTAHVMSGIAAGLAAGLLFALLRSARVRRGDAVVFSVLAAVSAFALFWFTIPETYPWGSVTILAGLLLAAVGCQRPLGAAWYVAGSVLTLSATTTNWMVGILAAWANFPWLRAVKLTVIALFVTVALAVAQKLIFPSSWLFIKPWGEKNYVMQQQSGGPLRCWASFFSHTVIMPEVTTAPHAREPGQMVLRNQLSAPASAPGPWGKVALGCWILLLAAGVYALLTLPDLLPLRLTLGLALLGQLALHTVYGAETFLYGAHYGPMMIALAALATRTRFRPAVLGLAGVMIVCLILTNFSQFDRVMAMLAHSQLRLDQLPP